MRTPTEQQPTGHLDPVLADAVEQARAGAVEMAGTEVGVHLGVRAEDELAVTHAFAAALPGYLGWYWAVTMVRAPDREPTLAEVVLLPGDGALLAQAWVPWSERLQPGDLSPGDLLPSAPDDPRLVPGYLMSDDPQVEEVALEIGLGRVRVLSREGRQDAAERWYASDLGPDSPMAKQAPAPCGSCGFFVSLAGSLRAGFGVCANEISIADSRVVSVEYGCGAHSETIAEPVLDEAGDVFEDELIDIEPRELADVEPADIEPADAELIDIEPADVEPADIEPAGSVEPAEPAAQLGEQPLVESDPLAVEPADGDHAADAGQAER
ncbi:MAG: DUF3027 domain-containing protein [Jatrophihabitans sp.]